MKSPGPFHPHFFFGMVCSFWHIVLSNRALFSEEMSLTTHAHRATRFICLDSIEMKYCLFICLARPSVLGLFVAVIFDMPKSGVQRRTWRRENADKYAPQWLWKETAVRHATNESNAPTNRSETQGTDQIRSRTWLVWHQDPRKFCVQFCASTDRFKTRLHDEHFYNYIFFIQHTMMFHDSRQIERTQPKVQK